MSKVWHFTPYSTEKNLGRSYNEYMSLVPEGDAGCLMDGDAQFLTPDWGHLVQEYANKNLNCVLTCFINRIHPLAVAQHYNTLQDSTDLIRCIETAERQKNLLYETTRITGSVSGTLMVVPKYIWKMHKFTEEKAHSQPGDSKILGVDNDFTNRIRRAGIPVLRMDGILIFHTYRLLNGTKTHLL